MEQCTPSLLEMGGRRGIPIVTPLDTMEATRPLVMWWQRAEEEVLIIIIGADVMEEVEEEVVLLGAANQVEQSS